jgi:multidrug efflux pump subunit AcrA (membrane-fusion protein)
MKPLTGTEHKMKTNVLLLVMLSVLLAGCAGAANSTPEVLPTVMLDAGASSAGTGTAVPQVGGGISASGYVQAAQQAEIASSIGGAIAIIDSPVGAVVKKGQVLFELSGKEQQLAAVEAAKLDLLTSQQALAALNDDADQARATAQLRLANAQDAYNEALKRRSWKEYRVGDDNQVAVAQADLIVAQDWLRRKQETYGGWADSPEDNLNKASALSELANAQKAVDRAQSNLNYLSSMPDTYEVAIADANLAIAKAEQDAAQKAFDQLADGPDPDALALAQASVSHAEAQLAAAQVALQCMQLPAPFAGSISKVYFQPGEWVQPGQTVLVLANLNDFWVETTDLSERDVTHVQVGQAASVYIEALNLSVNGTVSEVDPLADTLGGDVVYRSVIELDETPEGLRAGMSAEVTFLE